MTDFSYLHIRGTLAENMVYRPRPGHESSRAGRRVPGDPAFELVLVDGGGRVLLSVAPQVTARGCGNAGDPLRYGVRGTLPLHPDAAAYQLRRGEILLHAAAIPARPPAVTAPRCRESASGLTLSWGDGEERKEAARDGHAHGSTATDATGSITYGVVAVMESGRRITLARGLTEAAYTLDMERMPVPGKGTLYFVASDGVRSSEVEAAAIDVPARAPTVHILAPEPGTPLPFGQPVSVLGCCLDMGGQPCSPESVVWLLDGERVAAGSPVAAIEGIGPGTHRLTLAYQAGETYAAESSIRLEIEEPTADYRRWEELMAAELPANAPTAEYCPPPR
jgi:hypothetical protein